MKSAGTADGWILSLTAVAVVGAFLLLLALLFSLQTDSHEPFDFGLKCFSFQSFQKISVCFAVELQWNLPRVFRVIFRLRSILFCLLHCFPFLREIIMIAKGFHEKSSRSAPSVICYITGGFLFLSFCYVLTD